LSSVDISILQLHTLKAAKIWVGNQSRTRGLEHLKLHPLVLSPSTHSSYTLASTYGQDTHT